MAKHVIVVPASPNEWVRVDRSGNSGGDDGCCGCLLLLLGFAFLPTLFGLLPLAFYLLTAAVSGWGLYSFFAEMFAKSGSSPCGQAIAAYPLKKWHLIGIFLLSLMLASALRFELDSWIHEYATTRWTVEEGSLWWKTTVTKEKFNEFIANAMIILAYLSSGIVYMVLRRFCLLISKLVSHRNAHARAKSPQMRYDEEM